jgi:hypothetical protein
MSITIFVPRWCAGQNKRCGADTFGEKSKKNNAEVVGGLLGGYNWEGFGGYSCIEFILFYSNLCTFGMKQFSELFA